MIDTRFVCIRLYSSVSVGPHAISVAEQNLMHFSQRSIIELATFEFNNTVQSISL